MKVVLVHGIFDNAKIFRRMEKVLRSGGHEVLAPSLKPSDARFGIEDLAQVLKATIADEFEHEAQFALIGFSMGCLISRVYLQNLGGAERCLAFHAVSGPHGGSFWAYFYPGHGTRDMRPNSKLLQQLRESETLFSDIPTVSYRTHWDLMILPSKSSHWPIAQNITTNTLLHQQMVSDGTVLAGIMTSLSKISES